MKITFKLAFVALTCLASMAFSADSWWKQVALAQKIDTTTICHTPKIFPNVVGTCDSTGSKINGGPADGYSLVYNTILMINEGGSVLLVKAPVLYHLHQANEIRAFHGVAERYSMSNISGKATKSIAGDLLIIKLNPGKESKIEDVKYFDTVYPKKK